MLHHMKSLYIMAKSCRQLTCIQRPQKNIPITDSKSTLKPSESDEVEDKLNKQYREYKSDEHHVYYEVQYTLKKDETRSSVTVLPQVDDHTEVNIKAHSELFDDLVYSSHPSQAKQSVNHQLQI